MHVQVSYFRIKPVLQTMLTVWAPPHVEYDYTQTQCDEDAKWVRIIWDTGFISTFQDSFILLLYKIQLHTISFFPFFALVWEAQGKIDLPVNDLLADQILFLDET